MIKRANEKHIISLVFLPRVVAGQHRPSGSGALMMTVLDIMALLPDLEEVRACDEYASRGSDGMARVQFMQLGLLLSVRCHGH